MQSVTQIISPYVDFSSVPEDRLALAAERGTRVHEWIAKSYRDVWQPIPKDIQGYIESFIRWKGALIEKALLIEEKLVCDCYQFVGHVDFVGELVAQNGVILIDWKTPITASRSWEAQIAAYRHLVEEHSDLKGQKIARCGALMLDPRGSMAKLLEYAFSQALAFNAFLSALNAFRFFKGD